MNMRRLILVFVFFLVSVCSFGQFVHDRSYYSVEDSIEFRLSPDGIAYKTKVFYSTDGKTAFIPHGVWSGYSAEYSVQKTDTEIIFNKLDNIFGEKTNFIYIYSFITGLRSSSSFPNKSLIYIEIR